MSTRLAVDLDGVLANFVYGFVKYVKSGVMVYSPYEKWVETGYEPRAWDFPEIINRELFKQAISTFHEQPLFWQSLPSYVANCNAMAEFLAQRPDVNVVYLTARPSPSKGPSALVQTNRWLRAQGLLGDAASVVVVMDWQSKVKIVEILAVDAVIDDHPLTIDRIRLKGACGADAKLLSRPWNRDANLPRCDSLKEWLDSIK